MCFVTRSHPTVANSRKSAKILPAVLIIGTTSQVISLSAERLNAGARPGGCDVGLDGKLLRPRQLTYLHSSASFVDRIANDQFSRRIQVFSPDANVASYLSTDRGESSRFRRTDSISDCTSTLEDAGPSQLCEVSIPCVVLAAMVVGYIVMHEENVMVHFALHPGRPPKRLTVQPQGARAYYCEFELFSRVDWRRQRFNSQSGNS